MLLHTQEWWPATGCGRDQQLRSRLWHLFPAATLDRALSSLMADSQWSLLRRLYDHVFYRELILDRLTRGGALGLCAANARLAAHLWPGGVHGILTEALHALSEQAAGVRDHTGDLRRIWLHLGAVAEQWHHPAGGAAFAAVQSVRSALSSAACTGSISRMAGTAARSVWWAEAAEIRSLSGFRPTSQDRRLTRAAVWRGAFLYLDLALAAHRTAEPV